MRATAVLLALVAFGLLSSSPDRQSPAPCVPGWNQEIYDKQKGRGDKMKGMELLRKKIDQAGFKLTYVAERLNLTYQGFKKKLDGDTEFKASEIAVLKDLLKLSDAEVQAIFFDDDVD